MPVDSYVSAHEQAEMVQKEQQIQALKAKAKSRSTLMPLLVNGVVQCERKVSEEVSQPPLMTAPAAAHVASHAHRTAVSCAFPEK